MNDGKCEILLEGLAEYLPITFFQTDNNFILKYANQKGLDTFGYNIEDLGKGISVLDLVAENNRERAISNIKDIINGGDIRGKEYDGLKKNGDIFPIFVFSTSLFVKNEFIGLQGVVIDLSFHTNLNEKIQESEERFRLLTDSLPQFVWITSAENKLLYINKTLSDYLGVNIDELNTENWLSKVHPHDANAYTNICGDAYSKRTKYNIEYRFKNKIGDYRWIFDIATPRFTKDSQFLGFVGSCFDITDRKDAERAINTFIEELQTHKKLLEDKAEELSVINYKLQESEYQLKNLNASKDKFFSIVAHDLRSPFHGLIGISNILLEEYEELDSDSIKTLLTNINNSTKNLFKLVENLLSWSRLQTGKLEFKPDKIDLFESVLYSINLLFALAEHKHITLINKINSEIYVYADEKILNSILENLISNAIKFSHSGNRIEIRCQEIGDDVFVHIQDWGVGISEENKKLLFRLDTGFTTEGTNNEHGTGFGLLLCKDMVELLSGKISLQSKKGKGSTFTFSLKKYKEKYL